MLTGALMLLTTLVMVAAAGEAELAAAEAALKQEAAAAWAELEARGDAATGAELKAYIDRYQAAEVSDGEDSRKVSIPEVALAGDALEARDDTGGRVEVSSEDLNELLLSSRGIKSCWVVYQQETGSRPSGRIEVRFVIQPDGRPSEAAIADGPYRGTSLDRCLSTAIRRTQFPPYEGLAQTVEYPFVL